MTADLIHVLSPDELKYIVSPAQHLIVYLQFKHKFIEWKGNNDISKQLNNIKNGGFSKNNLDVLVDVDHLVEYIARNKYTDVEEKINDKNQRLTSTEVRQLLEYIKKYFMTNKLKMEYTDMKNISKQIETLFPNEDRVIFYKIL